MRKGQDSEFDEEVHEHLELLTQRYLRQGMTPAEAAAAARRQFGNATLLKEAHREMRTFPALEALGRTVRFAARQLRLNPAFTAATVLSLALGIGANTAIFTLLDQLVLRLLPVPDPGRLVMIWSTGPTFGDVRGPRTSSLPLCRDYARKASAFESVFCRYATSAALTVESGTDPVRAELASGNYFHGLRVGPALGRVFSENDDKAERGHPVVVLAHRYWIDRFGGDTQIVGRKVLVNKYPMEVVGVAAPGFSGIDTVHSPQIWLPLQMKPVLTPEENGLADRHYHFVQVFGRMKPGYTADSARASLEPLFRQSLLEESNDAGIARRSQYDRERFLKRTVQLERAANGYSQAREKYSTALLVLMGMAVLILLIACSNVASLLVARGLARRKEIAVRLSIGAGRGILAGQLLVESFLLAIAGAMLGVVLSLFATRALLNMLPSTGALLMLRPEPDLRILAFSTVVTVLTGLLFGSIPALQATKVDLFPSLKATAASSTATAGSTRLRKALVSAQVALSFLLLVAAGLFARTLLNLKQVETGLDRIGNLVTFQLNPSKSGYSVPESRRLYESALREIEALPGVTSATCTWISLLQGWAPGWVMRVEGHRAKDGESMEIENNLVTPGYWKTMGAAVVEGRVFDERDRFDPSEGEKLVNIAVVNGSFARRFFGNESAVGKRIGAGPQSEQLSIRIVGVVEDSLYAGPRQGAQPVVYFPFWQANFPIQASFYVRTAAATEAMFPALRRVIARLDSSLPIYEMKTLERQLDDTLSAERLIATLSIVFGLLAAVIAAIGLYGVLAFVVAKRAKEIGLRMALGAGGWSLFGLVLREIAAVVAAGLAIGAPLALLASRYISSQLYGVTAADAATFASAAAIIVLIATAAGAAPARRASTIDPLVVLRSD